MILQIESATFGYDSKLTYIPSSNTAATFVFRGGKSKIFCGNKKTNSAYPFLAKHIMESRIPNLNISVEDEAIFYSIILSTMDEMECITKKILESVQDNEFVNSLNSLRMNIENKVNSEEYREGYQFESLISRIQKSTLLEIKEELENIEYKNFNDFYTRTYNFSSMNLYVFGSQEDKKVIEKIFGDLDRKESDFFEIKGSSGEIEAKRYFKHTYGMFLNLSNEKRNISYFVLSGLVNFIQKKVKGIEFIFNEYASGIYVYDKKLSIENFYYKITNIFGELSEQELLDIIKQEISSVFNNLTFEEYSLIIPRLDYYGIDVFSKNQVTDLEIEKQLSIIMPQIYSKKSYIY